MTYMYMTCFPTQTALPLYWGLGTIPHIITVTLHKDANITGTHTLTQIQLCGGNEDNQGRIVRG